MLRIKFVFVFDFLYGALSKESHNIVFLLFFVFSMCFFLDFSKFTDLHI